MNIFDILGSFIGMVLAIIGLIICYFIGRYGENTKLGFWGSFLLCFLISPLIVFIILVVLKSDRKSKY